MKIRYFVLFGLVLLSFITFFDRLCINVISKYIKADLGFNNAEFGYVLGAFNLAYALFEIPLGAMGDRFGTRRVLSILVFFWSIFTALSGMVTSLTSMLIVRFLFGAGEAGAYPNISIVTSRWFPAQEVGRAQSMVWTAAKIGGALSPLVIVPIVHQIGWRYTFGLLGSLGMLWSILWYVWFRDNPSEKKHVNKAEIDEIESQRLVKKGTKQIFWKVILKNRNIWVLMTMYHFFLYAAFFFTNWSNTYFQEGRNMSEEQAKNFVALAFFFGAIGTFIGGFLSDYLSKKRGLKFGRSVVSMVGIGLSIVFIIAAGMTKNNTMAGYLLAFCSLTKDMALPVAFATCIDIGKHNVGTVAGSMSFAGQMGGFFITILFGNIVQATGNFNLPLFLIAGCLMIAGILWYFIDPNQEIKD